MGTTRLELPRVWFIELKRHAIKDSPRECCGIIAARESRVTCVYRAANVAERPIQGFQIDPAQQVLILRMIEAGGWRPCAVYHSHTCAPALPSQRDIDSAQPGVLHLIIGMSPGLTMRAYDIGHGRVRETEVAIV